VIRPLLDNGADVRVKNYAGHTPLKKARDISRITGDSTILSMMEDHDKIVRAARNSIVVATEVEDADDTPFATIVDEELSVNDDLPVANIVDTPTTP